MNNFFGNLKTLQSRATSYVKMKSVDYKNNQSRKKCETKLYYPPSSLNLLMIDKCNAGCVMCGHDYKNCGTSNRLTLDKIKIIYDKLDTKKLIEIVYGGGGEPFLNPELAAIASYTRSVCPSVQHTVISNMISPCNPETVVELLNNRVHFLISVNAASRDTFSQIAGVDAFSHVTANIKDIVRLKKELKSHSSISISIILMKQNISELPDFVRLAKEIGVEGVKAVYVRIYPEQYRKKSDGSILIWPEDSLYFNQEESNKRIEESAQIARELGVKFEHQPLFGNPTVKPRVCLEPWRSLYIGFNGELYPCAASEILYMNKVASKQYQSGNILEEDLEDIWNNPFWQALRKTNCTNPNELLIPECLCCGSSIDWWGVDDERSHIMDWSSAEQSTFAV